MSTRNAAFVMLLCSAVLVAVSFSVPWDGIPAAIVFVSGLYLLRRHFTTRG